MIRSLSQKSVTGLLLLAMLVAARPAIAADVPAPKRLPSRVVAYFSVPNVTELKKRFEQSQYGLMVKDPAMADFVADVKTALANASKDVQAQGGFALTDLMSVPNGNMTMAVLIGGRQGPGYVMMLDFGTKRTTIDQLMTKAAEGLSNNGAKKTQVDAGGVSITDFELPLPPPDPNAAGEAAPQIPKSLSRIGWFVKDTTLVVGNGAETLRSVIARWDGKHSSTFANNPVYRYIAEKGAGDGAQPIFEWFFDPISMTTGVVNAAFPDNFQAQLILGFLAPLGLDKVRGIGGTVNMVTPKYEDISRTVIYVDPPRIGALDLLKFPAIAQSPPKWVPANVDSYMSLNWDLKSAWRGIATLVDSFNAQGPGTFDALMDQLAQDPMGPMIHPKKDLVDHLSGRIQFLTDSIQPQQAGDAPVQRMLFALGVKNVDGIKATANKLANSPGSPVMTRQFRGETIYVLPVAVQLGDPAGSSIGLSITQGNLMIGVPDTLIEQAIRGDVEPLSGSADYKRLASGFPASSSSISYNKQSTQVRFLYDLLRSGAFPPAAPGAGFPGADAQGPVPLDFKKLPPFEAIEKYLFSSGSYIIPDKNGAVFVGFSPKKATGSK